MLLRSCDLKPCVFTSTCPVMTSAFDSCRGAATVIPSYPFDVARGSVDAVVIAMPMNGNSSQLSEKGMERHIFDPGTLRGTVMESPRCGTSVFLMKGDGRHTLAVPREGMFQRSTIFLSSLQQRLNGSSTDIAGIILEQSNIMPVAGDMLGNFQVVCGEKAPFFCRTCNTGSSRMTSVVAPQMSVYMDDGSYGLDDPDEYDLEGIDLVLDAEDFEPLATDEIGAIKRLTFDDDIVYLFEGHRDHVRALLTSLYERENDLFYDSIEFLDQNAWGENEDGVSLVVQFNLAEKKMIVALTLQDEMGYRSEDGLEDGEKEIFARAIEDWGFETGV